MVTTQKPRVKVKTRTRKYSNNGIDLSDSKEVSNYRKVIKTKGRQDRKTIRTKAKAANTSQRIKHATARLATSEAAGSATGIFAAEKASNQANTLNGLINNYGETSSSREEDDEPGLQDGGYN